MKKSNVIILFDHPRNHTADYCTQTARFVAKKHFIIEVLFKDARSIKEIVLNKGAFRPLQRVNNSLYIFTPVYVIPLRRFLPVVVANNLLNIMLLLFFLKIWRKASSRPTILWSFSPDHLPIIYWFQHACTTIYDCVDYHGDEPNSHLENKLILTCDSVFVNSHALQSLHHKVRDDLHLVPQGFALETFQGTKINNNGPLSINKPIIGYIGGINSRLDFDLLHEIATSLPRVNFVLVGPIQKHEADDCFNITILPKIHMLMKCENVFHVDYVDKKHIPYIIGNFDIGMIPYNVSLNKNKYAFPMKVFEYFYAGIPVISTEISELTRYPGLVLTASNASHWKIHIATLLKTPWPREKIKQQKQLACLNSWKKKIDEITNILQNNDIKS